MTAPVTPTPIVAYSGTLPDPSDPTTYGTRGRALWAWEVSDLINGISLIASQTNTNAVAAAEAAEAAQFVAGAVMWSAATNYATGAAAVSPTDLQTYRRNSPGGVDATDPAASGNWTLVGSKFFKKAGDTLTGNMVLAAGIRIGGDDMRFAPIGGKATFQCSSANYTTLVGAKPNGAGTAAGFWVANASTVDQWGGMYMMGDAMRFYSDKDTGPSIYLPMKFNLGGSDKVTFNIDGTLTAFGVKARQGTGGGTVGNNINWWWTGSALTAYVDGSSVGNVTLTSDYRIKRDVRPMEQSALDRIARIRPVLYRYADNEALGAKAEDREREGFIAHELAEVIPSAVEGEKDAPNQIQSLRIDALVAVLVKAVQEQQVQIAELRQHVKVLSAGGV
jgi:hypothetical protein